MTSPFLRKVHDHQVCIENALGDAEDLCRKRRVRLTPARRKVLEIVWRQHKPTGAYQILDILRAETGKAEPPTVYRALDFLMRNRLVHQIQSLNSFVGCRCPDEHHDGIFLICRSCGTVGEIPSVAVNDAISKVAHSSGFLLSGINVEAVGECLECYGSVGDE